jgi:pimeloyl-ACP methyl ester carboxylesterase
VPSRWSLSEPPRPAPRLERSVELGPTRLELSDWPGRRGPLVCLPDPLAASEPGLALAAELAPEWRILQVGRRPELPYAAQAVEAVALLDLFGFEQPVLLGERLAAAVALVVAAWYPSRLAGLVLVDAPRRVSAPTRQRLRVLAAQQPGVRAWLDAPPRWSSLEVQVSCPMLRVTLRSRSGWVPAIQSFLNTDVQSDAWC